MLGICVFVWREIFSFEAKYFGSKWNILVRSEMSKSVFNLFFHLLLSSPPSNLCSNLPKLHKSTFYITLPLILLKNDLNSFYNFCQGTFPQNYRYTAIPSYFNIFPWVFFNNQSNNDITLQCQMNIWLAPKIDKCLGTESKYCEHILKTYWCRNESDVPERTLAVSVKLRIFGKS